MVAAVFYPAPADKIHIALEDNFQFILHPRHIEQGDMRLRCKRYKYIHVAVGTEVCPQGGAKQRKLGNIPPFAKLCKFGFWDAYLGLLHAAIITQACQHTDEGRLALALTDGNAGFPFTLLLLLLSPQRIPQGPIYTVQSIRVNFNGGKDVTKEVLASMTAIPQTPK